MKKFFKPILAFFLPIFISINSFAQIPDGYYDGVQGLTGESLRSALHDIIDGHSVISYNGLWTAFKYTDNLGNNKVWDMYSNCNFTFGTDQCGNYQNICDCYNREHSFPKSWFNDASPMYSDLFHLVPTDGKVNGYRSNYPFGECSSGTTYGTGKLGICTFPGYTQTVFEPANEYKGDFARIYFYMLTRYMDKISSWSSPALSGNNFSEWTRKLLLKWHRQDPVSQKEIDRNNVIYNDYQHNRNPFVDNPEWADMIWDPNYTPSFVESSKIYFDIFPNPANDFINISFTQNFNFNYTINISDNSGRVIKSYTLNSNHENIDISELSAGSYFIVLNSENITFVRQFFVVE